MTLANQAYTSIRQDIISCTLKPESPLRLAELRDTYGVGFSPLREALNRLHSERFVVAEDLKGFRVAPWSLDDKRDVVETRIEIETSALRTAMSKGDDDWEATIISSLHALNKQADRVGDDGTFWELETRHHAFHLALIAACGSAWRLRIFEQLYGATERYRIPTLLRQTDGSSRDIKGEHTELAHAVLDRDARAAVTLLKAHYTRTVDWIQRHVVSTSAEG
ncbi:MAG: FCD domain-containing protein [Pseudomonadota bacterium]